MFYYFLLIRLESVCFLVCYSTDEKEKRRKKKTRKVFGVKIILKPHAACLFVDSFFFSSAHKNGLLVSHLLLVD